MPAPCVICWQSGPISRDCWGWSSWLLTVAISCCWLLISRSSAWLCRILGLLSLRSCWRCPCLATSRGCWVWWFRPGFGRWGRIALIAPGWLRITWCWVTLLSSRHRSRPSCSRLYLPCKHYWQPQVSSFHPLAFEYSSTGYSSLHWSSSQGCRTHRSSMPICLQLPLPILFYFQVVVWSGWVPLSDCRSWLDFHWNGKRVVWSDLQGCSWLMSWRSYPCCI